MIKDVVQKAVPGGEVVRTWQLKGGMVAEMVGAAVEMGEGEVRKVVVRRPSSQNEFRVLQLTGALGLPSPAVLFFDKSVEGGALVMDFVAGALDFAPGDVDGYLRQMAGVLADLHAADLSGFDVSFLRRRAGVCGEFGRTRPYVGADGLVEGLDVGRIETLLAKGLPGAGNEARLTHGDFWAGNMLWREGELTAVVDWEDAALGEPLQDLAQARVELVWLFGVEGAEAFTDYYRTEVDIDFTNLPYWDLCAVLRLLRLVKGTDGARDWGWLVDYVGEFGREDLTAAAIGREYRGLVDWLIGNWG